MTDFRTICSLWREEKEKGEASELLQACHERGIAATMAHRMNFDDDGQKLVQSMSAFGKALANATRAEKVRSRNQKEMDDFRRCLCSARIAAHNGDATPTETTVMMRDARHAFSQLLAAKYSNDLLGQIHAIYRVAKLVAAD